MPQVLAYACDDATTRFHKTTIDLREPGPGGKRESGGFVTYDGRDIPKATGWDHFRAERV